MISIMRGRIEGFVPIFDASVGQDGVLNVHEGGERPLTVDTGFNGGIALPGETLATMDVELLDFDVFRIATGVEVELPVYWGKVLIRGRAIETWFIPGDSLLGMEFLSSAGSRLSVDFEREEVELLGQRS